MSVISTSESGIEIAECNYDGYCRIRTKSYTWAGFASEVQSHCRKYGYDGIGYMKAWKDWEGNETPVNLGTDFYARILNSEYWKPITNDSDRFVRLREETGNLDQIWHFEREEDGGYLITSAKNGYALEMFAGEREPGTPAAAWCEDWGGYYQRWYIYNRNGCYVFVSKHFSSEQWALELQNNDDTDGTAITINTLNNESEQLWSIYKLDDFEPPVNFGDSFYGLILNWEYWKPISNDDDRFVRLQQENGASNQVWLFDRQEDGSYLITSAKNGYALEMYGGDTTPGNPAAAWCEDWGGLSQRWFIYRQGNGYVLLCNHWSSKSLVLELKDNSDAYGTPIVTNPRTNESSQIWAIYNLDDEVTERPTLTVDAGDSKSPTAFDWSSVYGETGYNVKIWSGENCQGEPDYIGENVNYGWSIQLPAGTYQAYVEAYNFYETRKSDVLTFTVGEHSHSYGDWVTITESTCAANGIQESVCLTCGDVRTQAIAMLNHSYDIVLSLPTCKELGYSTYTCTACGDRYVSDYVDALDHEYEYVVTEPTYTNQGYTTHTCVNCGDSYVDSYTGPLAPETDVKVTVGTVSGMAGDTVEVYLTLENAPELKILAISDLVYDTEHLTLVSGQWLQTGSMLSNWDPETLKGVHAFGENMDLNGDVFKLTFIINEDAPAGVYEIRCQITAKQRQENGSEQPVPIAMEYGAVEVVEYAPGDVDGNEFVTTDDAIYLLYYVMFGGEDYPVNQDCDFDGNGFITTDDAIYLLYHIMFGEEDYPLH